MSLVTFTCRARILFKEIKLQQQPTNSTSQQHRGSEGKLTVAKRIQSSLNVMKQSNLSELTTGSSTDSDSMSSERLTRGKQEDSRTVSEQERATCYYVPSHEWSEGPRLSPSQLPSSRQHPASDDVKLQRNTVPTSVQSQIESVSPEKRLPESPQRLGQVSVSRLGGPGSVVGILARSLSEYDRKALITELQHNNPLPISSSSDTEVGRPICNNPEQNREEPSSTSQPTCSPNQPLETLDENIIIQSPRHKQLQSDTSATTKVQSHQKVVVSTHLESEQHTRELPSVSTEEETLAEQQRALSLLVERREAEEMVAQLSRERMNSMLSEEEIAEVC